MLWDAVVAPEMTFRLVPEVLDAVTWWKSETSRRCGCGQIVGEQLAQLILGRRTGRGSRRPIANSLA